MAKCSYTPTPGPYYITVQYISTGAALFYLFIGFQERKQGETKRQQHYIDACRDASKCRGGFTCGGKTNKPGVNSTLDPASTLTHGDG